MARTQEAVNLQMRPDLPWQANPELLDTFKTIDLAFTIFFTAEIAVNLTVRATCVYVGEDGWVGGHGLIDCGFMHSAFELQ